MTADLLYAELMRGCLDGKAFTFRKELGQYRTQTVETETGKAEAPLDPLDSIHAGAAEVKKMLERCPELKATYPQKILSEHTIKGGENRHITTRQTDAVIDVPDDFAVLHGGLSFCALLEDEWKEQTETLVKQIVKRLRRYEMRTAAMFGDEFDKTQINLKISGEEIATDIWRLPLERCGLYPLQWDSEICGIAQLLKKQLYESVKEDCNDTQIFTILRNETEHRCVLRMTYIQAE